MPGYLPMPGLLAVKTMIANARQSMIPRRRDETECAVHQNFQSETMPEDEGVPKAVAILINRRSPSCHRWMKQILNASRSISGTCRAEDGSELAQVPATS